MSTALVKIRSERDRMSAIERRIADFVLENAQLLRDYSSQQLANALGISQSSVVKFCQKLGFKGYPDLKLSISEAVVRAGNGNDADVSGEDADAPRRPAADLWQRKSEAEEATRLINPPEALDAAGIGWRMAYTSTSQTGTLAPVLAGLAITVGLPGPLPQGLRWLGTEDGLPPLPDFSIALLTNEPVGPVAEALARHIEDSFRLESALDGAMAA